jgi:uncharacterized coiled-coil protein SlyX
MEARIARIEAWAEHTDKTLDEIKTILRRHDDKFDAVNDKFDAMRDRIDHNFRFLFGAIITVALGLAGLMAKGFGWL